MAAVGHAYCDKRGGAPIAVFAHQRAGAPEEASSTRTRKGTLMKTVLIAALCTVAATAATAQLASPISPGVGPTVRADGSANEPERAQLRADREKVAADKQRLKAARDAHDDDAIRAEQATLRVDMQSWHVDREKLADANSAESLKR